MRFTIRDLLWLTVVVAMAAAWLLNDAKWRSVVRQGNESLDKAIERQAELMVKLATLQYEKKRD